MHRYSYKRNVEYSCLWCGYGCLGGDKPLTVWDRGEETLIPQTLFPTCETSSSPEYRAGDQSQPVWRWLWSPHVNMFTHKVTHNTIQKNKQDSRVPSSYPRASTNTEQQWGYHRDIKTKKINIPILQLMKTLSLNSHIYSSNLCRSK